MIALYHHIWYIHIWIVFVLFKNNAYLFQIGSRKCDSCLICHFCILLPYNCKKIKSTYLAGSFFLGAMIFLASRILFQCFLGFSPFILSCYSITRPKTKHSRGGAAVTSKNHMLLLSTLGAELQNSCENAAFSLSQVLYVLNNNDLSSWSLFKCLADVLLLDNYDTFLPADKWK